MVINKESKTLHSIIRSSSITVCFLFLFTGLAAAQTKFYVSPSGNDDNPGTISAPFKTIAAARDAVRAINSSMSEDIIVYLRGGTYSVNSTITFRPEDSGKNGYRVYYMAYPGETPVLSGAVKVTGWTKHSGDIYKASLNRTTKLRNLYVNDKRAQMTSKRVTARGGEGTYSVTKGQAEWAWTSGSKSDGVKYNSSDLPNITRNKDDLEIVNGTTWNENIVCVRDVISTSDNYRDCFCSNIRCNCSDTGWGALYYFRHITIYYALNFLSPGNLFRQNQKLLYYYARQVKPWKPLMCRLRL